MSRQDNNNTFGLTVLVLFILAAFFFVNPMFRFSYSRMFMHDFLGMRNGPWAPAVFFSDHGFMQLMPLTIMFVLWAAVALWVYRDAERRGNNGLLWALFVFVGNVVGLIIYLILRASSPLVSAPQPPHSPAAPPAQPAARCPRCGGAIEPSYVACPHCGSALAKKCTQCGGRVEAGWKVCPWCGHAIDAS